MLKCINCGREYPDDYPVDKGCECGSKVFVLVDGNDNRKVELRPIVPEESHEDNRIENVTIVEKGVFYINLERLFDSPLIVKDERGVYFIELVQFNEETE